MGFQENLKFYREKAGYKTAKEFADILNLPYNTYAGYESKNREPKFETLCKIADLLKVSTDELLGRENNILGNNEDDKLIRHIQKDLEPLKYFNSPCDDITFEEISKSTLHFKGYVYESMINATIPKDFFISKINEINDKSDDFRKLLFRMYIHNQLLDARIQNLEKRKKELNKLLKTDTNITYKQELSSINLSLSVIRAAKTMTPENSGLFLWLKQEYRK